jgi:hypothetical protein
VNSNASFIVKIYILALEIAVKLLQQLGVLYGTIINVIGYLMHKSFSVKTLIIFEGLTLYIHLT